MTQRVGVPLMVGALLALAVGSQTSTAAEATKTIESLLGDPVRVPPEAPAREGKRLVARVVINGEVWFDLYDDPSTPRSVDYAEMYDATGALVAIMWADRSGREQLAVDTALLRPGADKATGLLVRTPTPPPALLSMFHTQSADPPSRSPGGAAAAPQPKAEGGHVASGGAPPPGEK